MYQLTELTVLKVRRILRSRSFHHGDTEARRYTEV